MNKPSKESLELFNQDITLILSKERLSAYENNLKKHNENLVLANGGRKKNLYPRNLSKEQTRLLPKADDCRGVDKK